MFKRWLNDNFYFRSIPHPQYLKWIYSKPFLGIESRSNLDRFELACVHGHSPATLKGQIEGLHWNGYFLSVVMFYGWANLTFEVQVAGSIGVLSNGAWVNLKCMYVVGVPGHHHVVPLVVVEWLVGVALHERWSVPEIEDVVDVTEKKRNVWECVCVADITV